jgi:hypothetical protein
MLGPVLRSSPPTTKVFDGRESSLHPHGADPAVSGRSPFKIRVPSLKSPAGEIILGKMIIDARHSSPEGER